MLRHSIRALLVPVSLLALVLIEPLVAADGEPSHQDLEFEDRIRPLPVNHSVFVDRSDRSPTE